MERLTQCLVLTEISLGNVAHALRLPFRGHLLAFNQSLLLNWAVEGSAQPWFPFHMSLMAGVAKLCSLNLSKFGPMTGITVQGWLFSSVVWLLGIHLWSRWLATAVMLFWPSLQGSVWLLIVGAFAGGHTLWVATEWVMVAIAAGTASLASLSLLVAGNFHGEKWLSRLEEWASKYSSKRGLRKEPLPLWKRAFKDMVSLAFGATLILHTVCGWADGLSPAMLGLRALCLTVGWYALCVVTRLLPLDRFGQWLTRRALQDPS